MATAKRVQHRRGTTAEHAVFTGAQGEVTVDTDKKTAVIGDGATAGGFPLQLEAVSSIAALEAAPTHGTRYLNAGGRSGEFAWRVGDYTAEVTADTQQGIYIASSSDPTGAAGCWVRVFDGAVHPEWFGGTTDTTIQAADDEGSVVALAQSQYVVDAQIAKDSGTLWRGSGRGKKDTTGSRLNVQFSGEAVLLDDSGTTYNNGVMQDLQYLCDPSTYTATAIKLANGIRQQNFERLNISGFEYGFRSVGGGELHFYDVFISKCDYSFRLASLADSWFYSCHGGSGPSYTGGQGYGFYLTSCNNLHFMACRPQVSAQNGARVEDCERIQWVATTCDQNDGNGFLITGDCDHITFTGGQFFDNGTTGANKAGVSISAADGDAIGTVIFDGVQFYDRNQGTGSQRQDKGIALSTAGTGVIEKVVVTGCDFTGVDTPISGAGTANIEQLIVLNCPGINGVNPSGLTTVGDAGITIGTDTGNQIVFDTALTATRTVTLPTSRVVPGSTYTITRAEAATGNFQILITPVAGSTIAQLSMWGTSVTVVWDGSAWVVSAPPRMQYVTSTQLADATNRVNTLTKHAGTQAFDRTTSKMYYARGSAATNPWVLMDDGTTVTPS